MISKSLAAKNIDDYISMQPDGIREMLVKLRQSILSAAPGAEETISYQMPAFKFHGMLVYFAGYKNHIGFYPTSSGIAAFKKELESYEVSKGTVRFPINRPVPYALIRKIVKFRVKENLEKLELKSGVKNRK